ncbi:MAG: hypothetical protein JJT89_10200 [Nitriliruptoraceae bacterium]|nr:hypothetical protein [Nitriliruptoraceae bacterium]
MEGGLALAVNRIASLAESETSSAGDIVLAPKVVTADDQVLTLEPSAMRLRVAQMRPRMNLAIRGRHAHAGRAHQGTDSNHAGARTVDRFTQVIEDLGRGPVAITTVTGRTVFFPTLINGVFGLRSAPAARNCSASSMWAG